MAGTLYAFDKNGNFVNAAVPPAEIQAISVFPPNVELDLPFDTGYFYAGFPVVAHDPVSAYGYITIYAPNLDVLTTREDATHPDGAKFITLPADQVDPPIDCKWAQVINVYDMTVDRFGSILVTVDLDVKCTDPSPDFPRALQILNRFNDFMIEYAGPRFCTDPPYCGPEALPCYHRAYGFANGDTGTIGIDTFFPYNRTELRYTWYTGDFNLLRDYVGVSFIELDPETTPPSYTTGTTIANGFGYYRVIGETVGNAPGSFNQNPPRNPETGELEDVDLSEGGPSGMGVDPSTDEIYICDPGNRRVQVFAPETGAFIRQIGDGMRGTAGNSFVAPSEVCVDLEGNVFIADINDVRVLRGSYPDRQFGGVGGRVRNGQLGIPLEGASVSLGNDLGTLALRSTNINGDYLISNLLVGTYYVTAAKFNYDSDTTAIQIISDTVIRADFNLNPNEPATVGAYTGYIVDAQTNLFLNDVAVQLVGTSLQTATDDIGRFQLNNILPGKYQAVFTHEDYATLMRDVEIFSGQTTDEPLLQMEPLE